MQITSLPIIPPPPSVPPHPIAPWRTRTHIANMQWCTSSTWAHPNPPTLCEVHIPVGPKRQLPAIVLGREPRCQIDICPQHRPAGRVCPTGRSASAFGVAVANNVHLPPVLHVEVDKTLRSTSGPQRAQGHV